MRKFFNSVERRKAKGTKFRKTKTQLQRLQEQEAWRRDWELKFCHLDYPPELKEVIQELLEAGYRSEYTIRYDQAGSSHRVDFANPELMHVIEMDGPSHNTPSNQRKDKIRDRHLRAAGWRVDRIKYANPGGYRNPQKPTL